ncbi:MULTISPECIES: helix-turn-helix domain-containing protein [Arcobacteraceae]|uniref:OmpR/PhoB-type domain-containing protein n=1 Tax=Poseidonibacter parvus TaxID=1850254 RepID=A0A1P8KLG0_9BACT|nr:MULTISPECIES: helix-turn-helix domain-containing protein [Arcobacteraceae]APW65389.1 hypothetical protein LPB137_05775 [Poseidonibacter parvus]
MRTITFKLSEQLENELSYKLKRRNLTDSEYILDLIEYDLLRIDLGEGFNYNKQLNKLYDKENKEVLLTRIGKELLRNLIQANGEIVSVEKLMEVSWKKDNVSIYTFRNMIKKIRDQTYYGIIKNRSNLGYAANIQTK